MVIDKEGSIGLATSKTLGDNVDNNHLYQARAAFLGLYKTLRS